MKNVFDLSKHNHQVERIVLYIDTAFTAYFVAQTAISSWPQWIYPVAVIALVTGWMVHIKKYKEFKDRAFIISLLMIAVFFIYGIFLKRFQDLLPLMIVLIVKLFKRYWMCRLPINLLLLCAN